jgi:DAK2 domain fusion protein YloV
LAVNDRPAQAAPGDPKAGNEHGTQPVVGGPRFRELLYAALFWLEQHHEIVNALNVFPVPDGDTGTNMLLTMKSACREVTEEHLDGVGEVAKAAAHGALMGARGNSGVILSQILRGMSKSLAEHVVLTGPAFAAALAEGSRVAYKGVNRPVEGTILTVAREAAAAAEGAAEADTDLTFVLERTVRAADRAVANTPNLLPVLAQAGKVDSGGKGLFYILEGIYREVSGVAVAAEGVAAVAAAPRAEPRPVKGKRELPPLVHGFDVQFLVEAQRLDVAAVREQIAAMGDCPLVEGDETLIKVHVHVPNPGAPLAYAISLGFVTDVVVENMDDMQLPDMPPGYDPLPPRFETSALVGEPAADGEPSAIGCSPNAIEGPGVIAVVPGVGLARVFRSLGTHCIIAGGQTMNPSTQDLLEAIRRLPTSDVLLLPNNGNIIMAASQAQALAANEGKNVAVIPSKSIPQGISALLALNPHSNLAHNLAAMSAAVKNVSTGEVTVAVQSARFDGLEIQSGDIIGLLNDRLTTAGGSAEAVVRQLLEQMDAGNLEVITLYYGEPVTAQQADDLRKVLNKLYPAQEIEVVEGGQPYYHYIISAE